MIEIEPTKLITKFYHFLLSLYCIINKPRRNQTKMNNTSIFAIGGGIAAAIAIAVVFTMSGVSDNPEPIENFAGEPIETSAAAPVEKITVLATFYPYYEFARNVAGDSATVEQYLPPGVDAHDWEPRPQEIQSLKSADVLVYNGLGMEPYVDNMIGSGEFDNVLFLKASEGVELIKPEEEHDDHKDHKEHDDHKERMNIMQKNLQKR